MDEQTFERYETLTKELETRRQEVLREKVGPFWDCLLWHTVKLDYDGLHGCARVKLESNGFGFLELEEILKVFDLDRIHLTSEKGKPIVWVTVFDPDKDFKDDWELQKLHMELRGEYTPRANSEASSDDTAD